MLSLHSFLDKHFKLCHSFFTSYFKLNHFKYHNNENQGE